MHNYLSNRKQRVRLNDSYCLRQNIVWCTTGLIPILGSLLFKMFLTDSFYSFFTLQIADDQLMKSNLHKYHLLNSSCEKTKIEIVARKSVIKSSNIFQKKIRDRNLPTFRANETITNTTQYE